MSVSLIGYLLIALFVAVPAAKSAQDHGGEAAG
jgi:hypothetical protein